MPGFHHHPGERGGAEEVPGESVRLVLVLFVLSLGNERPAENVRPRHQVMLQKNVSQLMANREPAPGFRERIVIIDDILRGLRIVCAGTKVTVHQPDDGGIVQAAYFHEAGVCHQGDLIGQRVDNPFQLKRHLSDPVILKHLRSDPDSLRVVCVGSSTNEIHTSIPFIASGSVKGVLKGNLEETDHVLLLLLRHVVGGSLDHADFRFVVDLLA